jgi:DNA polymerase (family X)
MAKGKFKRETAEREAAYIFSSLDGYSRISFCGSLRRGLETVGDLDVVVSASGDESVLIDSIKSLAEEVLANGSKIVRIVLPIGLQVDFYIAPERVFGAFELFLTGSKNFNILTRQVAKRFNHRLSQYGLLDEDGKEISVDELGILESLGLLNFSDPKTRSL